MKRFFTILFSLFAFTLLVPNVFASELTENLTLDSDSTECYVVRSGSDVTIDLNGHNITCTGTDAIYVENDAILTVKGEGVVQTVTKGKAALFNNGTVTLTGGTFTTEIETVGWYTILNHGLMTVKNGVTIKQTGFVKTTVSLIDNGYSSFSDTDERTGFVEGKGLRTPTLTINGGEFNGGMNTVKNDDNGVLEISNGHFFNNYQVAVMNWNIATINGGTFEVPTGLDKTTLFVGSYGKDSEDKGILIINGGTFKGDYILELMSGYVSDVNLTIKGGTFASNVGFVNPKDQKGNNRPTWNDIGTKSLTGGIFSDANVTPSEGYSTVEINQDNNNDGKNDVLVTNAVLTPAVDVKLTVEETYDTKVSSDILKYGTWSVSDNTVVSVNNGVITGLKKGTSTVKVKFGGDTKTYDVTVSKLQINKPTVNGTYTYNGENQEVKLDGYNEEQMLLTNTEGKNAGKYIVNVSLINKDKYEWADGVDTDLELEWNIDKAKVNTPTIKTKDYNYTGEIITPVVDGFNEEIMNATGDVSASEIGNYNIVYTLKDTNNYVFVNEVEEYTLTWNITKGKLLKPTLDPATYAYTGKEVRPTLKNYDEKIMTLGGIVVGEPVGKYTLKVSLKDKTMYTWEDGTTDDIELVWTITFGVPEVKATSTYNSVKLSWTEVDGAAGYQVYRCNSKGASCKKLTTTEKLTYTDKKLGFNKKYYYKVRAYRLDDESKIYGKFSSLLTKKTALVAPTITVSKDRYRNVLIEWKKVSGATRYYVYRCDEEGKNCKKLGFAYDTDFINKTAEEGVNYLYKVRAYRSGVYGKYSKEVEGLRLVDTISYSVKNTAYKTNKITIKNVETATKYYIYRATSKNGSYKKIKTLNSTGEALIYEDKTVDFNKKYYYKVKINNGVNDSDFSAKKNVTTNVIASPTFTYEIENRTVSININKVDGATGYQIMYSTDGETFTSLAKTKELEYTKTFEEDGNYYIKLRAYRKAGSTYYSNYSNVEEVIIATEK